MIAELSIPPFTTFLLLFGSALTLLALAGQITIKEATVGISNATLRIIAGMIGTVLIAASILLFLDPTFVPPFLQSSATSTPSASPAPSQVSIPVESYKSLEGIWTVTEQVPPNWGGWEIEWEYIAKVSKNELTMHGTKKVVHDPPPSKQRPLRTDEKDAHSTYNITLTGVQGMGTFEEVNGDHVRITGSITISVTENMKGFSGICKTGEEESTLLGSWMPAK